MDALSTETSFAYTTQPPLLVAASSDAAMRRVREIADAAGQRVGAELRIEEASERLRQQASASAMWIELDRDCGDALLELLDEALTRPSLGVVLSITSELVDTLGERLFDERAQVLVDASAIERAAALASATAVATEPGRANDVAHEPRADRLRQLSEEVSRIAAALAGLTGNAAAPREAPHSAGEGAMPEITADTVRSAIRARQMRCKFLPADLFADPAWDMLLDLLEAEIAHVRVPVSSLCAAAAVPGTTALRWLKNMAERGIFVRRPDPEDGRRIFVELSPEASAAMRRYFASVAPSPVL